MSSKNKVGTEATPPKPTVEIPLMPAPQPIPGCPAGLEYLAFMDKIMVHQKIELIEVLTGFHQNNKYVVRNANGQQCYLALEDTDTCMRLCCGPQRKFLIRILDNFNREVLRISREFKCCAGCCWCAGCCDCCAHEVKIETTAGEIIGYVRQLGSPWKAKFAILKPDREVAYRIQGPCCILNGPCCPCTNEFDVISEDGLNVVGKVNKHYAGFFQEMFSNAQTFSINFPLNLDVKLKATLMGALFLIDFMFYEQNNNQNK